MKKLVIVTGGTKGIGRATVERFASEGFDVLSCARNLNELQVQKKELEKRFPTITVHIFKADLSIRPEVEALVSFVNSLGLSAEVLVNNVGVFEAGQTHSEPTGALERMIETNLYSAYYLTRGLVGKMIDNRKGHIFNLCSTASITAYTNGGAYCISKFALYGFTKLLREELKDKNIRVTALLPGATLTPSWEGVSLPPERLMPPEDIAESILGAYKLSDRTVIEEIIVRPQLGDL